MKPHRMRMTHNLLLNYGLYKKMEICMLSPRTCNSGHLFLSDTLAFLCSSPPDRPERATEADMTKYHSDEYINFLKTITPDNITENSKLMSRCAYFFFFPLHGEESRVVLTSFSSPLGI